MTWPTDQQLANTFTAIRHAIDNLERDSPTLIHRAKIGTRDGYPTSSGRPHDGGNSPTGGYNDPVGELVCSDPTRDEVHAIVTNMCRQLDHATTLLLAADQSRARAFPPQNQIPMPLGLAQCANPHCDDLANPRKAGRCDACAKWRTEHDGIDAPAATIIARIERRRAIA